MGRVIQIPDHVLAGLQAADKACLKKHAKMWRRWIKRGWTLKGGAAKRWAYLAVGLEKRARVVATDISDITASC